MAYPTVVMESAVKRKVRTIDASWSTPQLLEAMLHALKGDGPALSTTDLGIEEITSQCALVVTTSGSTGDPKSVLLSAHSLLSNARATHKFLNATSGERWSLLLPTTHIAGLNILIRSIELGTEPVSLSSKADYTAIVPTQLFRALNGDDHLLKHLQGAKSVLVGGAALSAGVRNQAIAAGIKVVTTYGMSETSGGCVYNGEILDGVELEVRGGAIFIRGKVLALNLNLSDGWFETNDLGEIIDGKLVVIGRSDDVIISGGENLSLNTIESILTDLFPAIQCAAFSVEDPQWGQSLHIAVVGDVDPESIAAALENRIGSFAKPKGVHFVESLPLLGIGKVDRKRLAQGITHE